MIEMYWLTRIGVIGGVCEVAAIMGIILIILYVIFAPLIYDTVDDEDHWRKFFKKWGRVAIIVWVFAIIGTIFIPSKKELIAIYGVGTTIEYIKSNDKAKELPDKAVDALTKYLESVADDDKKD